MRKVAGGNKWSRTDRIPGKFMDCTPHLVLPDVIHFGESMGEEALYARTHWLGRFARERKAAGLVPFVPQKLTGTMTSFVIPDVDPIKGREWMWTEHRISVPFTQRPGDLSCEFRRRGSIDLRKLNNSPKSSRESHLLRSGFSVTSIGRSFIVSPRILFSPRESGSKGKHPHRGRKLDA